MILEDYVAHMNNGDYEGVANLFTETCSFDDGGARTIQVDDLVVKGRVNLKATFQSVFEAYKVRAEIVKLNANTMEYDVYLGETKLECIGCATLKEGKIAEYIVRPR
ncbi:hypothetical protein GNT69_04120 [Bacillus sp. B15-48]|nr:hypothetical protein [Bacillus sp. B15-48]